MAKFVKIFHLDERVRSARIAPVMTPAFDVERTRPFVLINRRVLAMLAQMRCAWLRSRLRRC